MQLHQRISQPRTSFHMLGNNELGMQQQHWRLLPQQIILNNQIDHRKQLLNQILFDFSLHQLKSLVARRNHQNQSELLHYYHLI